MRDQTGTKGIHKPIIFPNDFWQIRSQYLEVNETTPRVPLRVEFQPMSYFKFQMHASLGFGFNETTKQQGGVGTAEINEIKRLLVETNPYFLLLTATVSVLHEVYVYPSSPVIYHANQWILLADSRCWQTPYNIHADYTWRRQGRCILAQNTRQPHRWLQETDVHTMHRKQSRTDRHMIWMFPWTGMRKHWMLLPLQYRNNPQRLVWRVHTL